MEKAILYATMIAWLAGAACPGAELVSRASRLSQTAAGPSQAPIISADGRFIVFASSANNLVTNDQSRFLDLFLHDVNTGETRLISHAYGDAAYASFYAEGVLYAGDVNGVSHVFAYDLESALNIQLTAGALAPLRGPAPNGSYRPIAVAAGSATMFESTATNLVVEPDVNGLSDLFLHDLISRTNMLLSAGAVPPSSSHPRQYFEPSASPDGQRVAFVSRNIPTPVTSGTVRTEAFVRNTHDGSLTWISTNVQTILGAAEYTCSHPLLSGDPHTVAFKVAVPGSTNGLVLWHHLQNGQTAVVASNSNASVPGTLSGDGRYLFYDTAGQIFRYDAQTGGNELVTVNATGTGPANGISMRPVTRDGLRVAVVSSASDLTSTGNPARSFQIYLRDLVSGTTTLVSRNTNGQPAMQSMIDVEPGLSLSGTRVVFDYAGSDLVAGDLNEASDVFVFHASQETVTLISKALPNCPALTLPRGVTAELNSVSADGGNVTFTALSGTNREVFVASLSNGRIEQLSVGDPMVEGRALQGLFCGNGDFALYFREGKFGPYSSGRLHLFRRNLNLGLSEPVDPEAYFNIGTVYSGLTFYPAISEDGNLIVYSKEGNLYLKDMRVGTNQVIAQSRFVALYGRQMMNPRFSADHRWVTFQHSFPADITTNQFRRPNEFNLFARDLRTGITILISTDLEGYGLGSAAAKSMSHDGHYVAYDAAVERSPTSRTNAYIFDFTTLANTLICSNCSDPSMNGDARLVAYAGLRPGTAINDIYVKDRVAGTTARIGNDLPDDGSSRPLLSGDGRYVVFTSKASNYVADDDNGAQDVFLHDRYRGVTYRLSAGSAMSARPVMSRDGRTVVFQSFAGDLSPGDYNEALDIFSVRLGAGDADNDGMDDAWEVTYFNNATRDGAGDFDGDGHSDFQEFVSGTDPTNVGSVLEVIAIRSLNPGQVRVLWTAVAGKKYVIQSKPSLDALSWSNQSEPITADSPAMSIDLVLNSDSGFYRVALAH